MLLASCELSYFIGQMFIPSIPSGVNYSSPHENIIGIFMFLVTGTHVYIVIFSNIMVLVQHLKYSLKVF